MCESLYSEGPSAATAPYFAYAHGQRVVSGESCSTTSSAITGLAFSPQTGSTYPAEYRGALFFADYSRGCVWVMYPGANGLPDPATLETFVAGAANPVDLRIGPGGDLFYVDHTGGTIRRISHAVSGNRAPTAVADATPRSGPTPLTVSFDGTGSSDPNAGDTLAYAWDLNGDGAFDDSTAAQPERTYTQAGSYNVGLRVTDGAGASDTDSLLISADNTPPTASIDAPSATTK
jgi:hypothetical protein